jgi:hypothetical protein
MEKEHTYTAFAGNRLIASADLRTVVLRTKERIDGGEIEPILIFEDQTGRQVDFDFRGTPDEVLARLGSHPLFAPNEPRAVAKNGPQRIGPGRPRLGVVCREVSLLPRHWEWLNEQPGGASATLRRLIDEQRKRGNAQNSARLAREAAGKFMWAMAGNLPGFEEASRALYAQDYEHLGYLIREWPSDIRQHVEWLAAAAAALGDATSAARASSPPGNPPRS